MDLPREDALRWIVSRYAALHSRHGEAIGDPELLEPTERHFPDELTADGPGVARLLARMVAYAPLAEDLDVRLRFVEAERAGGGGGCGTGACGTGGPSAGPLPKDRVIDLDDGYLVEVPEGDVAHPTMLTTTLARSVGAMVLYEAGEDVEPEEVGALSELTATMLGFGVLMASGAHVYGKSCGGVRMHQHTHLTVEEHGVLLAIFAKLHGVKPGVVRAHLATTQREAFGEAREWVDSNARLMGLLRDAPETLADGVFTIEPVRGLLGRLLSSRAPESPFEGARTQVPPSAPSTRTEAERRKLDAVKAIVEEALREG